MVSTRNLSLNIDISIDKRLMTVNINATDTAHPDIDGDKVDEWRISTETGTQLISHNGIFVASDVIGTEVTDSAIDLLTEHLQGKLDEINKLIVAYGKVSPKGLTEIFD